MRQSAGEEAGRAEEGVVACAQDGHPAVAGGGGVGGDGGREGGAHAEVRDGKPRRLDGAVADQDADLAGPGTAPDGEVEGHRLESQPCGDLGGGGPLDIGGVGREDQRRAEAVGHAVPVFVKEEMTEIEQRGQVEGGRGGGLLGGGGGRGEECGQCDCGRQAARESHESVSDFGTRVSGLVHYRRTSSPGR